MKAVIAMSGGIDSSVAAALLKQEGYDVTGVTMRLWQDDPGDGGNRRGLDAVQESGKMAGALGIPHVVIDLQDRFAQLIIDDFCREYGAGRTPNPCVRCNRYIKFDALLETADETGAEFIATGHYAGVEKDAGTGTCLLKKGADKRKDQSYFLFRLTREQLCRTLFPVGGLTKERVREIAADLGIPASERPESQEVCFIPDNDYPRFLKRHLPEAAGPGPVTDRQGRIIGEHRGFMYYTVGQRRGLGIAAPEPYYVAAVEPERNTIVAGTREDLYGTELVAGNLAWTAGVSPARPFKVNARIRYRHPGATATVTPLDDDTVRVTFDEPQFAITPGQSVVFYDGDTVLGGGTISKH